MSESSSLQKNYSISFVYQMGGLGLGLGLVECSGDKGHSKQIYTHFKKENSMVIV